MTLSQDIRLQDLENRGFVHIPNFLSEAQLNACRDDFVRQPLQTENKNNPISVASAAGLASLRPAVEALLKQIGQQTNIHADCPLGAAYFATKRGVVFPWHQDHESYYMSQNHYDYLNLYIPVIKIRPDKSNLCVIPFDVLERENPATFRSVVRKGATLVHNLGDRILLQQNDTATIHVTRTDFDRIAHTPQLAAGDLLVMRGDIFHRTEDGETERVALSIRIGSSKTIVRRAGLAGGGLAKVQTMSSNFAMYYALFSAFEAARKDAMPLDELMRVAVEVGKTLPALKETPGRYLLRQKVRSGVVLSSVAKTFNELVKNRVIYRFHKRQSKFDGRPPVAMPGHA